MVDGLGLLSDSHVWLVACLVAAVLCGCRARQRGYSGPLFASLGLMLGPGALMVTWLSTQHKLDDEKGTGFIPDEIGVAARAAGSPLARQVEVALLFGLGWGLVACASQALTLFVPLLFQQTEAEYERQVFPGAALQWQMRTLWSALMLVGPGLTYLVYSKLPTASNGTALRVFRLGPWVIPLLLALFYAAVALLLAGGFQIYIWHGNR